MKQMHYFAFLFWFVLMFCSRRAFAHESMQGRVCVCVCVCAGLLEHSFILSTGFGGLGGSLCVIISIVCPS